MTDSLTVNWQCRLSWYFLLGQCLTVSCSDSNSHSDHSSASASLPGLRLGWTIESLCCEQGRPNYVVAKNRNMTHFAILDGHLHIYSTFLNLERVYSNSFYCQESDVSEVNPIIESADWEPLSLPFVTRLCDRLQEVNIDQLWWSFQSSYWKYWQETRARRWSTSLRVSLRISPWMRGSRCSTPWSMRTRHRCQDAGLQK